MEHRNYISQKNGLKSHFHLLGRGWGQSNAKVADTKPHEFIDCTIKPRAHHHHHHHRFRNVRGQIGINSVFLPTLPITTVLVVGGCMALNPKEIFHMLWLYRIKMLLFYILTMFIDHHHDLGLPRKAFVD